MNLWRELIEAALEGDGSTEYMPDVTVVDAVEWIMSEAANRNLRLVDADLLRRIIDAWRRNWIGEFTDAERVQIERWAR